MYKEYANHVGADEFVLAWVDTTLKNYLENNQPSTEEVEHIIDYLVQSGKRVSKMSYEQAKSNSDKWLKAQIKKGNDIEESLEDTEVLLDFGDGFKVVKLVGENAYKREGYLMSHCVASYYGRDIEIYSLRDKDNMPHCTMEKDQQIKGKGNGDIHPKYISYVVQFLEKIGMTVGDSEMKHLGYYNYDKVREHLHKDTKFYNKVYLPKDEKLIGVDGKKYASLDLLDIRPLIEDTGTEIKVGFNIEHLIKLSFELLWKTSKSLKKNISSDEDSQLASSGDHSQLAASGDYSRLASSGYNSRLASSGYNSQLAASGYNSKLASSGNHSKLASSGYDSKLASSGDYSKLAASGDYSKLASSGYDSKLASSGDHSQLAASGDYSRLASSGYNSKLASSGNHSKLASLGNHSKLASSGNHSKLASSGNHSKVASSGNHSRLAASGDSSKLDIKGSFSVGACIGINGRIKGVKGTWITLAEYDSKGIPILVKSAQIDGDILKENTWYELKDGEFTEVK